MKAIMARLRAAPQPTPGERVTEALAPFTDRRLGYTDAIAEGIGVCQALGVSPLGPLDAGDLIRFAYAQGWQAAEKRIGAPDVADLIDLALRTPDAMIEKREGETLHGHQVRAVQQVVAYGVPKR